MSFSLRKVAGTAALAVAASALTLPFAAPAHAATPVEKAFVIADNDGDDYFGLYTQATPTGTLTPVVSESLPVDVHEISSSRDSSRVIYIQDNYSTTTGAPVNQQVIVRDVNSARVVRVLATQSYDFIHYLGVPQLSPDGTQAVWELYDDNLGTVTTRKSGVGAGSASTLKAGYSPYAFLDATTLLVQDIDGNPFTLPYAGGTATATTGVPVNAFHVAVSPDGSHLAWGLFLGSSPNTSSIQIAHLNLAGGVASTDTVMTSTPGLYNKQPSFSRNGEKVYFAHNNGSGGPGDLWSVTAANPTDAAATAATATDELDVALTITDDGTAPDAAGATSPFTINGTRATITWTLPDTNLPQNADLSGVIISRAGRSPFYVPAPNTSVEDTGLTVGTRYDYTITAVDRSGNQATGATRSLRAIQPSAYFGNPTSQYSTKASFPVRFATGGNASTQYFVKYLPYGGTTKTWVNGATGATRTFGVAGNGTTVASTTAIVGGTYTFYVKALDEFGNSSAYVTSAKAVVPWDQTKATFSGGTNRTSSAAYRGTFRRLTSNTQYARVTLVGNRLQVIGWKCSSCGSFAIYQGSTKIGTVSTYSSTTRARLVLFTKTYTSSATRTFTIRPLGTAGHPVVALDGFAMRR